MRHSKQSLSDIYLESRNSNDSDYDTYMVDVLDSIMNGLSTQTTTSEIPGQPETESQ